MFYVWKFVSTAALGFGLLACTQNHSTQSQSTSGKTTQNVGSEKTLKMGLSADYPPFEFKKNGEVVGFDVDVAQAVARELGYTLSIQDMDFSSIIPSLQSGQIDFAMAGMTVTEERKKNMEFSDTYFTSSFALIVPRSDANTGVNTNTGAGGNANAGVVSKDLSKTLADLSGKKIGVQLGTTMEKFAKEKAKQDPSIQVVSLGKYPLLIEELKSGRLQGVVSEDVQAAAFVQANPVLTYLALASTGDGYAIAFQKDKGIELKNSFNQTLKKLQDSGVLDQIRSKWLGTQ
jgi:polar amino acid transport system substrate-binding protein